MKLHPLALLLGAIICIALGWYARYKYDEYMDAEKAFEWEVTYGGLPIEPIYLGTPKLNKAPRKPRSDKGKKRKGE